MSKTPLSKLSIVKPSLKKSSNKPSKTLKTQKAIVGLQQQWDGLPARDRLALMLLSVFLIVVIGGLGGYSLRQAATQQTEDYQNAIRDYFWLRGQSANINLDAVQKQDNQAGEQLIEVSVREYLQQAGARNPQVLKNGDNIQISFGHPNQAIASKIMSGFIQQGLEIIRLDMSQNSEDKSMQVQATLTP